MAYTPSDNSKKLDAQQAELASRAENVIRDMHQRAKNLAGEVQANFAKLLDRSVSSDEKSRTAVTNESVLRELDQVVSQLSDAMGSFGDKLPEDLRDAVNGFEAVEVRAVRNVNRAFQSVGEQALGVEAVGGQTASKKFDQQISTLGQQMRAMADHSGINDNLLKNIAAKSEAVVKAFGEAQKASTPEERASKVKVYEKAQKDYEETFGFLDKNVDLFYDHLTDNQKRAVKMERDRQKQLKKLQEAYNKAFKQRLQDIPTIGQRVRASAQRVVSSWVSALGSIKDTLWQMSVTGALSKSETTSGIRGVQNALNISWDAFKPYLSELYKISDRLGSGVSDFQVLRQAKQVLESGIQDKSDVAAATEQSIKLGRILNQDASTLTQFVHQLADKGVYKDPAAVKAIDDAVAVLGGQEFEGDKASIVRMLSDPDAINIATERANRLNLVGDARVQAISEDMEKLIKGTAYGTAFDKDGSWYIGELKKALKGEMDGAWVKTGNQRKIIEARAAGEWDKIAPLLIEGIVDMVEKGKGDPSGRGYQEMGRQLGLSGSAISNFGRGDAVAILNDVSERVDKAFSKDVTRGEAERANERYSQGLIPKVANWFGKLPIIRGINELVVQTGVGLDDIATLVQRCFLTLSLIAGLLAKDKFWGFLGGLGKLITHPIRTVTGAIASVGVTLKSFGTKVLAAIARIKLPGFGGGAGGLGNTIGKGVVVGLSAWGGAEMMHWLRGGDEKHPGGADWVDWTAGVGGALLIETKTGRELLAKSWQYLWKMLKWGFGTLIAKAGFKGWVGPGASWLTKLFSLSGVMTTGALVAAGAVLTSHLALGWDSVKEALKTESEHLQDEVNQWRRHGGGNRGARSAEKDAEGFTGKLRMSQLQEDLASSVAEDKKYREAVLSGFSGANSAEAKKEAQKYLDDPNRRANLEKTALEAIASGMKWYGTGNQWVSEQKQIKAMKGEGVTPEEKAKWSEIQRVEAEYKKKIDQATVIASKARETWQNYKRWDFGEENQDTKDKEELYKQSLKKLQQVSETAGVEYYRQMTKAGWEMQDWDPSAKMTALPDVYKVQAPGKRAEELFERSDAWTGGWGKVYDSVKLSEGNEDKAVGDVAESVKRGFRALQSAELAVSEWQKTAPQDVNTAVKSADFKDAASRVRSDLFSVDATRDILQYTDAKGWLDRVASDKEFLRSEQERLGSEFDVFRDKMGEQMRTAKSNLEVLNEKVQKSVDGLKKQTKEITGKEVIEDRFVNSIKELDKAQMDVIKRAQEKALKEAGKSKDLTKKAFSDMTLEEKEKFLRGEINKEISEKAEKQGVKPKFAKGEFLSIQDKIDQEAKLKDIEAYEIEKVRRTGKIEPTGLMVDYRESKSYNDKFVERFQSKEFNQKLKEAQEQFLLEKAEKEILEERARKKQGESFSVKPVVEIQGTVEGQKTISRAEVVPPAEVKSSVEHQGWTPFIEPAKAAVHTYGVGTTMYTKVGNQWKNPAGLAVDESQVPEKIRLLEKRPPLSWAMSDDPEYSKAWNDWQAAYESASEEVPKKAEGFSKVVEKSQAQQFDQAVVSAVGQTQATVGPEDAPKPMSEIGPTVKNAQALDDRSSKDIIARLAGLEDTNDKGYMTLGGYLQQLIEVTRQNGSKRPEVKDTLEVKPYTQSAFERVMEGTQSAGND